MTGNVLDSGSIAAAAKGCDAIFHTAAAISPNGGWEAFRGTNVSGTNNVIAAARESSCRLLHLSSVAVYGSAARYRDEPTSETTPLPPLREHAYYARSKRESEELVMGAHERGELWATAVRPNWIYGERDRQFVPRAVNMVALPVVPLIAGGRSIMSMVHAANVADGAVRALCTDAAGGLAYNLTNDYPVTVEQFVRLGAEGLGRRARTFSVPLWLARGVMKAFEGGVQIVKGSEMAGHARGLVGALSRDNPFTSDRARREIGWSPPVHPDRAIPAAFRWYAEHRRDGWM
jgi:nucleoside-diphosphate-sugar epimerase